MYELTDTIIETIRSNFNIIIISSFCFIIFAAYLEWNSIKRKAFKDYKPIIISIGILGTFVGIFCGLWNFNTEDITDSVPLLLAGLKFAFITSILGMFVSIVMSFIENSQKELSDNDSNEHIKMKILRAILSEQKETNKNTSLIHDSIRRSEENINEQFSMANESLKKALDALSRDILTEQKETNKNTSLIHDSIRRSEENINRQFSMANESLKKALDALSKGATEEIITALEKVISDFNKNLTEQFGDNFKQLNESVKKMIVWQENYKTAIEQIEKSLQTAVTNIETISDHTQKFANNYEKISDHTQKFVNNYEKISVVSKDLHQVIEANQNQIKNIETHMNKLKKIGDEANLITASIDDFSKSIQGSLSDQSEGLNKLSDNLRKQLDRADNLGKQLESSLGNLNTALTSLTNKFKTDYEDFLKSFKQLLPKQ